MSADEASGARGPAERRLDEHLELLRINQPTGPRSLAHRVIRTARWQRALREPIRMAALIAGAVIDGLRALTGGRRRSAR